ncbi:hypothetical protein Tco_0386065 [Tanacetum coccineum]
MPFLNTSTRSKIKEVDKGTVLEEEIERLAQEEAKNKAAEIEAKRSSKRKLKAKEVESKETQNKGLKDKRLYTVGQRKKIGMAKKAKLQESPKRFTRGDAQRQAENENVTNDSEEEDDSENEEMIDAKTKKGNKKKEQERSIKLKRENDEESRRRRVFETRGGDVFYEGSKSEDEGEWEDQYRYLGKPTPLAISLQISSTNEVVFMFNMNFLTLFRCTIGTLENGGRVPTKLLKRIREDDDISYIDWCGPSCYASPTDTQKLEHSNDEKEDHDVNDKEMLRKAGTSWRVHSGKRTDWISTKKIIEGTSKFNGDKLMFDLCRQYKKVFKALYFDLDNSLREEDSDSAGESDDSNNDDNGGPMIEEDFVGNERTEKENEKESEKENEREKVKETGDEVGKGNDGGSEQREGGDEVEAEVENEHEVENKIEKEIGKDNDVAFSMEIVDNLGEVKVHNEENMNEKESNEEKVNEKEGNKIEMNDKMNKNEVNENELQKEKEVKIEKEAENQGNNDQGYDHLTQDEFWDKAFGDEESFD